MSLKIVTWNAHSVFNKKSEIDNFLKDHEPDFFCISETNILPNVNFEFNNYVIFRVDRKSGGVAILAKDHLRAEQFSVISLTYAEAIFIKIPDQTNNDYFLLGSVYCSPSANMQDFTEFYKSTFRYNMKFFLTGDFNARHINWNNRSSNPKGHKLNNLVETRNLQIHAPTDFTHIAYHGSNGILDFAITKYMNSPESITVLNELSSDHLPVQFVLKFKPYNIEIKGFFNYAKADWKQFRYLIDVKIDFLNDKISKCESTDEIDQCVSYFSGIIHSSANETIPIKPPRKHNFRFSDVVLNLTRLRNQHRNKFRRTGRSEYKTSYLYLNKRIHQVIKEINTQDFDQKLKKLKIKDLSLYNFARGLKRKKSLTPPLLKPDNTFASTDKEKAEALSFSFKRAHELTVDVITPADFVVNQSINNLNSFPSYFPFYNYISMEKVLKAIDESRNRKSPGFDGVTNEMLKNLSTKAKKSFCFLLNTCLKFLHFPNPWKLAVVVAFPKKGKDPSLPSNYRPISLLPVPGKIYEKVLLYDLYEIATRKKLFRNEQFGFRNFLSTTHALLNVAEMIGKAYNQRKSVGALSLDIEKAFDSVWHDGIIHKLMKAGFPTFLIKTIQSFLKNRKAQVRIGCQFSNIYQIRAGVPQGAILSPFLYILFINDMPVTRNSQVLNYADDTILLTTQGWKDIRSITNALEYDFKIIKNYYDLWKLRVNAEKTVAKIFSKSFDMIRKTRNQINFITLDNNIINWSETMLYLGLKLDTRLNFVAHTNMQLNKTNRAISTLFSLCCKQSKVNKALKCMLVKLYLRPIFAYAPMVISNGNKSCIKKMQQMQNKCLRMALGLPRYAPSQDLHRLADIPTVEEFFNSCTEKFYWACKSMSNGLVENLGNYSSEDQITFPFGKLHKMPKKHF
jgi:hypothetical protein